MSCGGTSQCAGVDEMTADIFHLWGARRLDEVGMGATTTLGERR